MVWLVCEAQIAFGPVQAPQLQPSPANAVQFSLLVCKPQRTFVPRQPPAQTHPSVAPEPVVHCVCVTALLQ